MPRNQPTSPSPPPPPASFPFTSGSFDFPHASTSPPPPPRPASARNSRFDQITQFLSRRQQEREQRTADRDDGLPQRQPRAERERRRQVTRVTPRHAEREPPSGSLLRRNTPSTVNRPRATPSERYLRRSHARLRDTQRASEIDPNDILESLSDFPLNPFHPPSRRERSPVNELDNLRRQPKRRKLDHDSAHLPTYDGFKYGYKGQVVPGRLRMDIVTCDGGEYEKYNSERLYKVQNVLDNDKSVYCSESSRCNLLLKHMGETPFCLDKVVIRAPDRGFTAPVQEGLVFVSMSPENLISGTAAYQIEYSSRSPGVSPAPSAPDDQLLSLREAIDDPQTWEQSRQRLEERIERLRVRSRRFRVEPSMPWDVDSQGENETSANNDNDFTDNCPYHIEDGEPMAAGVSAPTPPPFTVTTEDEQEDSDENEALPSAAVMADRLRRESRWRPDSDDDDEGDDLLYRFPPLRRAHALDSLENFGERRWRSQQYIDPIRATRLRTPSRIEPKDSEAEPDGLISPHARFFIARHKNKITIKFHPAM